MNDLCLRHLVQTVWGEPSLIGSGYPEQSGRSFKLSIRLHVVLRLMRGAVPQPPMWESIILFL